ncbi:MAG: hypothetical protein J1F42_07675 [Lachnospiraceae bacterium]|nr:hypothetical protein [Lachnospiraceae bacterium]
MDEMDKREVTTETTTNNETEATKDVLPEVVLQYRGYEVDIEAMTERVKAHYYSKGYKKDSIKTLQIYAKPEDFTAYYVINDGVVGKVNLFYD